MCIIIYSPQGKIPRKHLQRSLKANPDGWGFMFSRDETLIIRKGMDSRLFWKTWRNEDPTGPVVFHARIGTQGSKSEKNCHPFVVRDHGLAVVHNGILKQHCKKDSPVSDTQLFVWDILDNLPNNFLSNDGICTLLEHYIGWSKLVFMDVQGNVTILNEVMGHWHNGRWYSNRSYEPVVKKVQFISDIRASFLQRTTMPFWEVPQNGYAPRNGLD